MEAYRRIYSDSDIVPKFTFTKAWLADGQGLGKIRTEIKNQQAQDFFRSQFGDRKMRW